MEIVYTAQETNKQTNKQSTNEQLASHSGKETDEQTKYLFQRLGILLMRGNLALVLNRTPRHVDAEVDGDQDFDL